MDKFSKKFYFLVFTAAFLSLTARVEANSSNQRMYLVKDVSKEDMTQIYEGLNLPEQQKKSLEANREAQSAKVKELKERIKLIKQQLKDEIAKPEIDQNKIEELKSELNRLQAQLTDLRVEGIMGVREILTPEQYERFDQETR